MKVIKYNKEEEPFSSEKIYQSVLRSGGSKGVAKKIAKEIEKSSRDGIKTADIYKKVQKLIKKEDLKSSLRFNLKKAFKNLGPSGFPFEKYIAEVHNELGYTSKTNQFVSGKCCVYEIDFTAEKDGVLYIGECKYRNLAGAKVHTKDALANYARFLDIKSKSAEDGPLQLKSILVTNTRLTTRANKYSQCVGVKVLGWRTPKGKGLEYLVESKGLYPITILPSLKKNIAEVFVQKKIMLAKDLLTKDIDQLSKITKLRQRDLEPLIKEAQILLD